MDIKSNLILVQIRLFFDLIFEILKFELISIIVNFIKFDR